MISKIGLIFAGSYLLICGYLLATQGLTGESFIAVILGLPWSLLPSYFEYWGTEGGFMLYNLLLSPILLNAAVLYWIGKRAGRLVL